MDDPHVTDGMGTNLNDILKIIENHRIFRDIREKMMERFWNMFIVDALISNFDRNNGNWGILKDSKGNRRIAPVYDNGNSFSSINGMTGNSREGKARTMPRRYPISSRSRESIRTMTATGSIHIG